MIKALNQSSSYKACGAGTVSLHSARQPKTNPNQLALTTHDLIHTVIRIVICIVIRIVIVEL